MLARMAGQHSLALRANLLPRCPFANLFCAIDFPLITVYTKVSTLIHMYDYVSGRLWVEMKS
jgi:hypothetical protein